MQKKDDFRCKKCGRCCLKTGHVDISDEDVALWKISFAENFQKIKNMLKSSVIVLVMSRNVCVFYREFVLFIFNIEIN